MFRKNNKKVIIGGKKVEVKPLSLTSAVEIALLLAPILPYIENHKYEFSQAIAMSKKPDVLSALFQSLSEEMMPHTGVFSRVVALLVGVDPEEFARLVTVNEVIDMLPVLNRVHNIPQLYVAIVGLLSAVPPMVGSEVGETNG